MWGIFAKQKHAALQGGHSFLEAVCKLLFENLKKLRIVIK
jgi:hypothetical protein